MKSHIELAKSGLGYVLIDISLTLVNLPSLTICIKQKNKTVSQVNAFNLSTREADAGGIWVQEQPGLEILSQNNT